MRFQVEIEGVSRTVDVTRVPGGSFRVEVDGDEFAADAVVVPGGVNLRIDGRVYDVLSGGADDATTLAAGPLRTTARLENERNRSRKRRGGNSTGGEKELRASMPGRIVKVLVAVGDAVEAGQTLVIIEAMKMENEFRATVSAKVAAIEVREGQSVESGALLLRLE